MGDFELITLRNGARAVRHKGNGEVMHPSVGPWDEALRLYVEQPRLAERLTRTERLCIYDVGLGAATNAVAALTCWRATPGAGALELHSFEVDLEPARLALEDAAGFPFLSPFEDLLRALLQDGQVDRPGLRWTLHLGDALQRLEVARAKARADLVFHDPFSPESNPTLWTAEAFAAVRACCSDEAVLVTYSASTRTRVSLLLGGFFVGVGEAIGTKRETTIAAVRRDALEQPLDARWLARWERSTARAPHGAELTADLERAVRQHPQFR